jgi:hypothetical protein
VSAPVRQIVKEVATGPSQPAVETEQGDSGPVATNTVAQLLQNIQALFDALAATPDQTGDPATIPPADPAALTAADSSSASPDDSGQAAPAAPAPAAPPATPSPDVPTPLAPPAIPSPVRPTSVELAGGKPISAAVAFFVAAQVQDPGNPALDTDDSPAPAAPVISPNLTTAGSLSMAVGIAEGSGGRTDPIASDGHKSSPGAGIAQDHRHDGLVDATLLLSAPDKTKPVKGTENGWAPLNLIGLELSLPEKPVANGFASSLSPAGTDGDQGSGTTVRYARAFDLKVWVSEPESEEAVSALSLPVLARAPASLGLLSRLPSLDLTGVEEGLNRLFREVDSLGEHLSDMVFANPALLPWLAAMGAAVAVGELVRRQMRRDRALDQAEAGLDDPSSWRLLIGCDRVEA